MVTELTLLTQLNDAITPDNDAITPEIWPEDT